MRQCLDEAFVATTPLHVPLPWPTTMLLFIRRFLREDDGPTAVEYAVMIALIVAVCITSVGALAQKTGESFDETTAKLSTIWG